MPNVLDRQIDSLDTAAAEAAGWEIDHEMAMVCRDYEDLLAAAVSLYENVKASVVRWQQAVKDRQDAEWVAVAKQFESRYHRLRGTFGRIEQSLAGLEAEGYRLDGAAEFREAKADLDLMCQFSVDRMLETDRAIEAGRRRGRTTAEVRDELRRRLGA